MNKTLLFAATVAGALGVASSAAAQPKLVKKWESEAAFKVPESVYFDKAGKVLYVSNIDGEPWGKDGAGSIGKLGLDGKVIAAEWVKGLNAPKGMALSKGTLWVADLSEVVGIDVAKGAITTRIPVEGAAKLNDLAVDAKGVLYVSDSETKKVHRIEGKTVTTLLENLKGPNGVLAHNGAIYVLDSGGLYPGAARQVAEDAGRRHGEQHRRRRADQGRRLHRVGVERRDLPRRRRRLEARADGHAAGEGQFRRHRLRSGDRDGLRADVLQEHRHRLHAAVAPTAGGPRVRAGPPTNG